MHEPLLLSTRDKHAQANALKAVRGTRYWSVVEVPGDVWFLVEGSQLTARDQADVRRYITTSIYDALEILRKDGFAWKKLCAYVRAPIDFTDGYIFQRVDEVHQFDPNGELLLRFSSGLMVYVRGGETSSSVPVGVARNLYP